MPYKPTKAAVRASEKAAGVSDVAPARVMEEAPKSVLSRTSTIQDELDALDAKTYDTVNLEEVEMRIGLASRIVIEHALRSREARLSPREKCDIALRAITVLEGSRQEITWRDELRKRPQRKTIAALADERKKVADRIIKAAARRKEVQIAQAEEALKNLQKDGDTEPVN